VTTIEIAGETLGLLADRGVVWPRRKTLLIADPHFGKPESFRAVSVAVPEGLNDLSLARLSIALHEHAIERLVILGDFWHDRASRTPEVLQSLAAWRARHPAMQVELILGNHDRRVGGLPAELGGSTFAESQVDGPFVYSHYPDPDDRGYVLAGHLHPAVRISGRGRQSLRLECYWFSTKVGVLPAFGEFTGQATIEPAGGDAVYAIAGDEVLRIP
jgi:uncharacterized protein